MAGGQPRLQRPLRRLAPRCPPPPPLPRPLPALTAPPSAKAPHLLRPPCAPRQAYLNPRSDCLHVLVTNKRVAQAGVEIAYQNSG